MFLERGWRASFALAAMLSLAVAQSAHAVGYNRLSLSGEAIGGFDAVSYWRSGQPTPGSRAFRYEWQGAVWLFASKADLEKFKTSPQTYAPAFGGYCAYAMSKGISADIHPYFFKIEDKKLLFFYSAESRDEFIADPDAMEQADDHWSAIEQRSY